MFTQFKEQICWWNSHPSIITVIETQTTIPTTAEFEKVNLLHVGEFKTLQSSSNFPDRWLWFSPNQISVLNTYKHMFEEVYFESIPLLDLLLERS